MARYAIITDLDECVGCLACCTACKTQNDVQIGQAWQKVLRVGPFPRYEGAQNPDVSLYFLPLSCQHCENPACVTVCPTGASMKLDNGTVQIDGKSCIGCMSCVSACPYGVRYLNEELNVVEKCTMCSEKIENGELPQCVTQCGARARYFGDLDEGIESFEAPAGFDELDGVCDYEGIAAKRITFGEHALPYTEEDLHHLTDTGNGPSYVYVLRKHDWRVAEECEL